MGQDCPADGVERAWRLIGLLAGATVVFQRLEPWAYEAVWAAAFTLLAWRGLVVPRLLLPVLTLATLNLAGFWLSALLLARDDPHAFVWAGVSTYLGATALVLAVNIAEDPRRRLPLLVDGLLVAGGVSAAVALAGRAVDGPLHYFLMNGDAPSILLPTDAWNLRAVAFFKDPNVYAAFMVLPILAAMDRLARARGLRRMSYALLLAFMGVGMMLATSRGAWLNLGVAWLVFAGLALAAQERSGRRRLAWGLALGCLVLAGALGLVLLLWEGVRGDVMGRAVVAMPYDRGPFGRPAGLRMAVEELVRPFGLGPLQFWKAYVARSDAASMAEWFRLFDLGPRRPQFDLFWREHPHRTAADVAEFWRLHASNTHNTYLDQFMAGGWLSGLTWPALLIATFALVRRTLRARPPFAPEHAVFAACLAGILVEAAFVDVEHWRHLFLVLGVLWGSAAAAAARVGAVKDSVVAFQGLVYIWPRSSAIGRGR